MTTDFDDESLVAFLDGELPSQEAAAIQTAADTDTDLQQRIATLRSAWDALEELPEEAPNPQLAETTIAMVSLAMEKESDSFFQWIAKNRWATLAIAVALAACAGAILSANRGNPNENRVIDSLLLISNYDGIRSIPSTAILEDVLLNVKGLEKFDEQAPPQDVVYLSLGKNERRDWILDQPVEKQRQLKENLDRFNASSSKRKNTDAEIADFVLSHDQPEKVLDVIRNYANLDTAVSFDKDLEALDTEGQLALVRREVAGQYVPNAVESTTIYEWGQRLVFSAEMFFMQEDTIEAELIFNWDEYVKDAEIEELIGVLGPQSNAATILSDLSVSADRHEALLWWISGSSYAPQIDSEELISAYEGLANGHPDRILIQALPSKQAQNKLLEISESQE